MGDSVSGISYLLRHLVALGGDVVLALLNVGGVHHHTELIMALLRDLGVALLGVLSVALLSMLGVALLRVL